MSHVLHHYFADDPSFSYEALRAAGYANTGGADIAEVIAICSGIKSGNESDWEREWRLAADRATRNARTSLENGNKLSARESLMRASNYYRTAEFYRRDNPFHDEVSKELAELSINTFYSAMDLMPFNTTRVKVPYEHTTLPATIFRPDDTNTSRATIIVNGGFDSTKEEMGLAFASAALQLGFNVLTFDGPGQGEALREQRLVFRPDWEKVVTPVIDYVFTQPWSDKSKVVLLGVSMGGYLVPRAVAFEHRAAAVIVNDGVYDFGSAVKSMFSSNAKEVDGKIGSNDTSLDENLDEAMSINTGLKWAISNARWVFGKSSAVDILRSAPHYTLEGLVDKIKTPFLVLEAPDDHFFQGQPKQLFDRLQCEKQFVALAREEGASMHCHVGCGARLVQVIFDYLMPRVGKHS